MTKIHESADAFAFVSNHFICYGFAQTDIMQKKRNKTRAHEDHCVLFFFLSLVWSHFDRSCCSHFQMFTACLNDENIKTHSTINKRSAIFLETKITTTTIKNHSSKTTRDRWRERDSENQRDRNRGKNGLRHLKWTILIKWNIHLIIFRDVQQIFQQH